MQTRHFLLSLVIAALVASCGGGDDGVGPGDSGPPVVRYSPNPADTVVVVIPETVMLSVSVTPRQPFTAEFTLGDSVVAEGSSYALVGEEPGESRYRVVVVVADPDRPGRNLEFDKTWDVRVVTDEERPTPAPTAPAARRGDLPRSVLVSWDRPPDRLVDPEVPLAGFEIAWSSSSFSKYEFERQDIHYVEITPSGIGQSAHVLGLDAGNLYYFRVRTVDELARESWPTAEVSSIATGSFTLTGNVWQLDATGWPAPVGSVLVTARDSLVTTKEDGRFVLADLPDNKSIELRATEGSGDYTLPIWTTPLDPVDRNLDLVLVPQQQVDNVDALGVITQRTLREFLLAATLQSNGDPPHDFHPWAEYPVKVWVWDYEYAIPDSLGGGTVSYQDAFAVAIDRWNDGLAGEQALLEYVPVTEDFDPTGDESQHGVMFRIYEGVSGTNLGEVSFVRPSGGRLTESDPQLLQLGLRSNLYNRTLPDRQALAERVIAHELGHVLGLSHVSSWSNLMHLASDQAEGVPTPEEIFVARYLRHGGPDVLSNWIVDP